MRDDKTDDRAHDCCQHHEDVQQPNESCNDGILPRQQSEQCADAGYEQQDQYQ